MMKIKNEHNKMHYLVSQWAGLERQKSKNDIVILHTLDT